MEKKTFTHLKYIPKNTIYCIVDCFDDPLFGKVIGYASENNDVYFRTENDFSKFEFLKNGNFEYKQTTDPIKVKFKINNEWQDYLYQNCKLTPLKT